MDEAYRVDMTAPSVITPNMHIGLSREAKPFKLFAGAGFEPATYRCEPVELPGCSTVRRPPNYG